MDEAAKLAIATEKDQQATETSCVSVWPFELRDLGRVGIHEALRMAVKAFSRIRPCSISWPTTAGTPPAW